MLLPDASVAVYVTMVVPVGKTKLSQVRFGSPGTGQGTLGIPVRLIVTVEPQLPPLSSAVATNCSSSSKIEHWLVLVTMFGGVVSVGAVVSLPITVMICVQDAVPTALVAVQVIVV